MLRQGTAAAAVRSQGEHFERRPGGKRRETLIMFFPPTMMMLGAIFTASKSFGNDSVVCLDSRFICLLGVSACKKEMNSRF